MSNTFNTEHFKHKFPLRKNTRIGPRFWTTKTQANDHAYNHYGIAIQDDEIVLDFDPRNYRRCPITKEIIDPWLGDGNIPGLKDILPDTYKVMTPSGGWHLYFTKPADIKISHKQMLYPGVDFQGKGRMVVGAGSVIEGVAYQAVNTLPPAEIPLDFLETLAAPHKYNPIAADNFEDDDPEAIDKFKAWLGVCDPAISGQGGNDQTLKTAYYGRDLGLSSYATFEAMYDIYNSRCSPPWSDDELNRLVDNAYRYAKGAQGSKAPLMLLKHDVLLNQVAPEPTETVKKIHAMRFDHLSDSYVCDEKDRILPNNPTNARLIIEQETSFKDLLWFDQVFQRVRWERQPYWRNYGGLDLIDMDVRQIYDWINGKPIVPKGKARGYKCNLEMVRNAIYNLADTRARNPLTEYLDSLQWDGIERLETYLQETCGSPDDMWTRIAGRKWLIGAVQRAYNPGCQMDYVLVLQGEQGIRKSKWIEVLGGEWASTSQLNPEDKDLYMKMLGNWIMEVPELNRSLRKHDLDLIKGFITVREDNFRKPYAHISERVPRLTVFIGSLNPNDMGFLKDITGDRRYWPVYCKECDAKKLAEIRDQLLAEAVNAYKKGETSELTPEQIIYAKAAQEAVVEHDPWYSILYQKVEGQEFIHTIDVYNLLGLAHKDINTNTRTRAYNTLKQLGYKFKRSTQSWHKISKDDIIK